MIDLRWESWAAILAFAISLVYVWSPGPYPMGAFTFIAQTLFLLALVSYGIKVCRDLRSRDVV
jgi:hypothetical protein